MKRDEVSVHDAQHRDGIHKSLYIPISFQEV